MCGIVGRINADRQSRVDSAQLRAATDLLAHRGPDGEGFFLEGNVGFGHRRLAVVDLAGGAQPLCNEDGSVWVTFNGEIYNHLALRSELEAAGHRFATRSDTEVLVHGYEQWGDELTSRLRGMFAFAIWDRRRRRGLLVRDRLGIKPLYWTRAGGDLLFASEIKALFAFPDVRRALGEARVPEYLALRYVPGPYTLFDGIERLQPGHALSFQNGELRIWQFWDVPVSAQTSERDERSESEENERFTANLLESVRMRLMGDVPVGLFLSGGIDSTAVAWAMKQADPSVLKSFSIGFEGDSQEEVSFARMAAQAIGTDRRPGDGSGQRTKAPQISGNGPAADRGAVLRRGPRLWRRAALSRLWTLRIEKPGFTLRSQLAGDPGRADAAPPSVQRHQDLAARRFVDQGGQDDDGLGGRAARAVPGPRSALVRLAAPAEIQAAPRRGQEAASHLDARQDPLVHPSPAEAGVPFAARSVVAGPAPRRLPRGASRRGKRRPRDRRARSAETAARGASPRQRRSNRGDLCALAVRSLASRIHLAEGDCAATGFDASATEYPRFAARRRAHPGARLLSIASPCAHIVSGVGIPNNERPEARVSCTASVSASRASRIAGSSTSTRFSRS